MYLTPKMNVKDKWIPTPTTFWHHHQDSRRRVRQFPSLIPRATALSLLSTSPVSSTTVGQSLPPTTTTTAFTPPPLKAEAYPSTATYPFFKEQQDPTLTPNHPSNTSHPKNLETLLPAPPMLPPLFTNSIAELKDLSAAIASFQHCYEDLRDHLDSIKATISSKLSSETPHVAPIAPYVSDGTELKKPEQESNPHVSNLEDLCKRMCGRSVRVYLTRHLPNKTLMREAVPRALRLATNTPRLVLESMGKFYLLSSKAVSMNPKCLPSREASIFILECFLLMMSMDSASGKDNGVLSIEKAVEVEAEEAALAWRKRMVVEGGLASADQIDVRGLLLFVACFGIPSSFQRDDIRVLLAAADSKEIVGVLRNSHLLMNKISEIVTGMLKHNKDVDAVNLIYTFGLDETFDTQNILASYLLSKESSKTMKRWEQSSAASVNEANKKQLAALKSVRRCLERHKVDPAKLLPGWRIHEKITTLEKDIDDARTSADGSFLHRKVSETETPRKPIPSHEAKRARYMGYGPHRHMPTGRAGGKWNFSSRGRANHRPYNHPRGGGLGTIFRPEGMVPCGRVHGGAMADRGGRVMNRGTSPYAWHRDSGVSRESSPVGVGSASLYRSVEGFDGVPDASPVGVESRGSDLYHEFADAVGESESSFSLPMLLGRVSRHSPNE